MNLLLLGPNGPALDATVNNSAPQVSAEDAAGNAAWRGHDSAGDIVDGGGTQPSA